MTQRDYWLRQVSSQRLTPWSVTRHILLVDSRRAYMWMHPAPTRTEICTLASKSPYLPHSLDCSARSRSQPVQSRPHCGLLAWFAEDGITLFRARRPSPARQTNLTRRLRVAGGAEHDPTVPVGVLARCLRRRRRLWFTDCGPAWCATVLLSRDGF